MPEDNVYDEMLCVCVCVCVCKCLCFLSFLGCLDCSVEKEIPKGKV